jgi:hypothetical protein
LRNLHTAVSANPDNTDNDEAIIQALQHALDQKMKKQVWFDGVEMLARQGTERPQKVSSSTQTRQE